jgi:hypothetical protein
MSPEFTVEDARRWIRRHHADGQAIAKTERQARRLGLKALPAMVELLASGTDDEVTAAFAVLHFNGAIVEREGDSVESVRYRVRLPDGEVRMVEPTNFDPDDFGSGE